MIGAVARRTALPTPRCKAPERPPLGTQLSGNARALAYAGRCRGGARSADPARPVERSSTLDPRHLQRNVGQLILVCGVMSDVVGRLLLSFVSAMAAKGGALRPAGTAVVELIAVVAVAVTAGRWRVRMALRPFRDEPPQPAAVVVLVLLFAAQALGFEAVLGASPERSSAPTSGPASAASRTGKAWLSASGSTPAGSSRWSSPRSACGSVFSTPPRTQSSSGSRSGPR